MNPLLGIGLIAAGVVALAVGNRKGTGDEQEPSEHGTGGNGRGAGRQPDRPGNGDHGQGGIGPRPVPEAPLAAPETSNDTEGKNHAGMESKDVGNGGGPGPGNGVPGQRDAAEGHCAPEAVAENGTENGTETGTETEGVSDAIDDAEHADDGGRDNDHDVRPEHGGGAKPDSAPTAETGKRNRKR